MTAVAAAADTASAKGTGNPAVAANAAVAESYLANKLDEYGESEKTQSLNPIAYQYWSDMNQTGNFRRARSTFYWTWFLLSYRV